MSSQKRNWPDLAGRVEGDTHVLPVRVYFEDTDCGGVVYHANFLKFCERGRSDFIRLLGIDATSLAGPEAGGGSLLQGARLQPALKSSVVASMMMSDFFMMMASCVAGAFTFCGTIPAPGYLPFRSKRAGGDC